MTGEGLPALVELIEARLGGGLAEASYDIAPQQLGMLDWLYRSGEVVRRVDNEDGSVTLTMRATAAARHEIERRLYMRKAAE